MEQGKQRHPEFDWLHDIGGLTAEQIEQITSGFENNWQDRVGGLLYGYEPNVPKHDSGYVDVATRLLHLIHKQSNEAFADRPQILQAVSQIKERPLSFLRLVQSFNQLTKSTKKAHPQLLNDVRFPNYRDFHKRKLHRFLPTFTHLFTNSTLIEERSSMDALRAIDAMMERGETTKEEPYIDFHLHTDDTNALLTGGLFAMYTEQIMSRFGWEKLTSRDELNGVLIEVASLRPESKLWDTISNPQKLNMVKSNPSLHPAFISNHS